MTKILLALLLTVFISSCAESQKPVERVLLGAPCEGCEAIFEYGGKELSNTDTLPDFDKKGVKIKVEGTIYQADGKTPAKDIILYVYHTNQEGIYAPKKDAKGWGKKHGYNRTWLKTNKDGYYSFYTLKPAPYPNRNEPAHIHYEILEPNGKYYYLNSCHFEGNNLLSESDKTPKTPRGGSGGLLTFKKENGLLLATRNIILGKNIPGYE